MGQDSPSNDHGVATNHTSQTNGTSDLEPTTHSGGAVHSPIGNMSDTGPGPAIPPGTSSDHTAVNSTETLPPHNGQKKGNGRARR